MFMDKDKMTQMKAFAKLHPTAFLLFLKGRALICPESAIVRSIVTKESIINLIKKDYIAFPKIYTQYPTIFNPYANYI